MSTSDSSEGQATKNESREFSNGWTILLGAFVGIGVGISSLSFYAAGVFMTPIEQEFGWSRSLISAQSIFGVAILAVLSPLIGSIIDRVGIRVVAFFSLAAYSIGLFATSFSPNSIVVFYAITLATATFAAGSSPVTFTRAVTGWFDRSRGLALGIALMSTGVVGFLAPMFLTEYVAEHGWRMGYRMLALIVGLGAVVAAVLLRDDPAAEGLRRSNIDTTQATSEKFASPAFTRKQLLRNSVFVRLAVIFFLISLSVSGLIVHFIPMLLDTGMAAAKAGKIASVIGLSVILGRIITGVLIDRYFAPHVAAGLLFVAAIGYLVFLIGGTNYALLAGIAVGFSMGAEVDLIGYLVSRYFGLKSYGKLYGVLYGIFLLGAGLAPFLTGLVYDLKHTYEPALIASAIALFIASGLCLRLAPFPEDDFEPSL